MARKPYRRRAAEFFDIHCPLMEKQAAPAAEAEAGGGDEPPKPADVLEARARQAAFARE